MLQAYTYLLYLSPLKSLTNNHNPLPSFESESEDCTYRDRAVPKLHYMNFWGLTIFGYVERSRVVIGIVLTCCSLET